jgi:putative ABC transport system permease protein
MNILKISYKSLTYNLLSSFLNVLLIAFGIGILTLLLLGSQQISQKLENNAKDIDLVVGAKGSPLQLILSSVYYVDFPTGNISLNDANELSKNPMVKLAVPLALGDNFNGFRIVGTDKRFVELYNLSLDKGKYWNANFEVNIGANIAKEANLKVGDIFYGSHGLTENEDIHKNNAYRVVGILKPQLNVCDNLVLTNIASVWKMHEDEEEHHVKKNLQEPGNHYEENHKENEKTVPFENGEKEITTLLIKYRSPMAIVSFPRMVNQTTNMQSASPALESARLFSLIGVGLDTLEWFALLIMAIAAISIFISLYNSLKEKKYDLAILRTLGASKIKLFKIVIFEGLILSVLGAIIGIALGHVTLLVIGNYHDANQAKITGFVFSNQEFLLLGLAILIGFMSSIIPAIQAYRSDISKTISKS